MSTRHGTSPPASVTDQTREVVACSPGSTGPARSMRSASTIPRDAWSKGRRYRHDERGIRALCRRLLELDVELVAIERPDGVLIERLLDSGLNVIAVHPNQLAAHRARFSAAGGKSDSFDAFVLAELARTDAHRFRVLVPDSDATKALRALSRAREDLVAHRVALANELRAQLECFLPGAIGVFAEIDSPITLAFLKRYPSPGDARGLGEQRMARFLALHHYCGRKSARELVGRLHAAASGRADTQETEARRQIALALVAALEPVVARIGELTSEIRGALADHTDGPTFRSLFKTPSPRSAPPPCWPRSATAATATPPKQPWPPTAARRPSPSNPANPSVRASAGPATTASEPPSGPWPTPAAITTPGPPTSTSAPSPAAPPTSTPSASSAAPGAASSGASGKTTTPTTPTDTPPSNDRSPLGVDTGSLMRALRSHTRHLATLARAITQIGRAAKTVHLLDYCNDPHYRRRILGQLNRGESRHDLARQVRAALAAAQPLGARRSASRAGRPALGRHVTRDQTGGGRSVRTCFKAITAPFSPRPFAASPSGKSNSSWRRL